MAIPRHGRLRSPGARRRAVLPMAVVAAGLLAACGRTPAAGPTITLYNGQHPQTTAALVAAFERRTGISVVERDGDEDVLAQQIAEEGRRSPADVFYAENSQALQFLAGRGLLSPLAAATLSHVPAQYDSPTGDWVGVTARVSGLVVNTRLVPASQVPSSVLDLAGPQWAGKLALAPSETDLQPVITSLSLAEGRGAALQWLEGLKRNAGSHLYPDDETLTAEVNAGQAAVGIVNSYYWYRLRYELGAGAMHSRFVLFAPHDPGYVLDVSGAAVLASSRHAQAAQRFVAFLVSKTGEEIIAHSRSYEYPLGSGVRSAQPIVPFSSLAPAPITVAQLGDGSEAIDLLHQAQLL